MKVDSLPTRAALEALADEIPVGATSAEEARELAVMVAERQQGRGT